MPEWKKLIIPFLFTIILTLGGLVYNGLANDLEKKADKAVVQEVKEELREKVDNQTLQLMINNLQIQQDNTDRNFNRLFDQIQQLSKKLDEK